jgi:hypothetical protein
MHWIHSGAAAVAVALLLAGCEAGPGDTDLPSPYIYEEDEEPQPGLISSELADAVIEAVQVLANVDPEVINDTYLWHMGYSNAVCPDIYGGGDESESFAYWVTSCAVGEVAAYEGESYRTLYNGASEDDFIYFGWYLDMGASMLADGQSMTGSGTAANVRGEAGSYTFWQSSIQGTWESTRPEFDGTWFDESSRLRPSLDRTAFLMPSTDGRGVVMNGGITGLEGALDTVSVSNVALYDAALGSQCPEEVGGVVSVRDPDGDWYDIVFDGPLEAESEVDPADCDGCGAVWFRGQYVDDVCIDFSFLLDWGTEPW